MQTQRLIVSLIGQLDFIDRTDFSLIEQLKALIQRAEFFTFEKLFLSLTQIALNNYLLSPLLLEKISDGYL